MWKPLILDVRDSVGFAVQTSSNLNGLGQGRKKGFPIIAHYIVFMSIVFRQTFDVAL